MDITFEDRSGRCSKANLQTCPLNISAGVDGGLSGGSSMNRHGREDPTSAGGIILTFECLQNKLNLYTIEFAVENLPNFYNFLK